MLMLNKIIAALLMVGTGLMAVLNLDGASSNGWLIAFAGWSYVFFNEFTRKSLTEN
jgi:hypothetical protein